MPKLNSDILTDVLIECLKTENDSRTLGKFMLSGREQLKCAINYFSKARFVEICESSLVVSVKVGRLTYKHEISYQFSMINLLMKVLASSIEEFCISSCPENFDGIEYFLKQKINKVKVLQNLPQKYRTLLASCDYIDKITFCSLPYNYAHSMAVDMIPLTCRELELQFISVHNNFIYHIVESSKESFKNIEKLTIKTSKFWPKRYTSPFIVNHFPKLQSIDVIAVYENGMRYMMKMFKDRKLYFLEKIGKSNIAGKLVFKNRISPNSRKAIPSFGQVLQDVHDIPGVTSDEEEQTITRTVELKENLVAEFVLSFNVDFDYYKNL